MAKLTRRRVLLAAIESSYNTDAEPTGTNAVLVEDIQWQVAGLRMVERPAIRSSLGALQQLYGGSLLSLTFQAEVKGSGTAGTAPELGTLLRGCAMDETVVAATSVAYAPISGSQESLTLYFYEDGTLVKMTGCRGSVSFNLEVGNKIMASFEFTGHFSGPTDVALVTPTYDSTVPAVYINSAFEIGSYGAIIQALEVNLGISVQIPPDVTAADGYGEVLVGSRDVQGSFNPQQTLVATKNFMAAFKAGTTEALDSGVVGATAGNRVRFQLPAVYYRNIAPSEREGVLAYDLSYGAAESSGDDEVTITFT